MKANATGVARQPPRALARLWRGSRERTSVGMARPSALQAMSSARRRARVSGRLALMTRQIAVRLYHGGHDSKELPRRLVPLELAHRCCIEDGGVAILVGVDGALLLAATLEGAHAGGMHEPIGEELAHFFRVDGAPNARRFAGREADGVALLVDAPPHAVDPSEAQRDGHGLRPRHALPAGVALVEADEQLALRFVVRLEPRSKVSRVSEECGPCGLRGLRHLRALQFANHVSDAPRQGEVCSAWGVESRQKAPAHGMSESGGRVTQRSVGWSPGVERVASFPVTPFDLAALVASVVCSSQLQRLHDATCAPAHRARGSRARRLPGRHRADASALGDRGRRRAACNGGDGASRSGGRPAARRGPAPARGRARHLVERERGGRRDRSRVADDGRERQRARALAARRNDRDAHAAGDCRRRRDRARERLRRCASGD